MTGRNPSVKHNLQNLTDPAAVVWLHVHECIATCLLTCSVPPTAGGNSGGGGGGGLGAPANFGGGCGKGPQFCFLNANA